MSRLSGTWIKQRLVDLAHQTGKEAQSILNLYAQERMLYRISQSSFKEAFILKGGFLMYGMYMFDCRPTVDIDFMLDQIAKDEEEAILGIRTACETMFDDGITFSSKDIRAVRIGETISRRLIRLKIPWNLVGLPVRGVSLIDVGLGDVVLMRPINMRFPVLIDELPSPEILVCSIEAVIAEKFEAAITLGMINSRLKDYFDIYAISTKESIDGSRLKQQILATMQRRGTTLHADPYIFSREILSNQTKLLDWKAFCEKLGGDKHTSFTEVLVRIRQFLEPLYLTIIEDKEFSGVWDPANARWND